MRKNFRIIEEELESGRIRFKIQIKEGLFRKRWRDLVIATADHTWRAPEFETELAAEKFMEGSKWDKVIKQTVHQ